jgi:hypothetical protein
MSKRLMIRALRNKKELNKPLLEQANLMEAKTEHCSQNLRKQFKMNI